MSTDKIYDAFLICNSQDKSAVEQIGNWLVDEEHMNVWLDRWNLVPGDPWQEGLEKALDQSKCCVVFIGPSNFGPWQNEEMRSALDERVSMDKIRVVPVLLPGGHREQKESELPRFLRRLTWVEFGQSIDEPEELRRLVSGINGISPGRSSEVGQLQDQNVCPFRGLEIFREQDADFFFGREAAVQHLVKHLQSYHFLAVIGPSGSGKSSIVQAGLIPKLRRSNPLVAVFTPSTQPLTELAFAIHGLGTQQFDRRLITNRLWDSEEALYFIAQDMLESSPSKKSLMVLVVDQFEELFTQSISENERRQFISLLMKVTEKGEGKVKIVITMRSDFVGRCSVYPLLDRIIKEQSYSVPHMRGVELRAAIEEPAHIAGLRFESGLVDRILEDVSGISNVLPLLEFALYELYKHRRDYLLTHEAYKEISGVEGSLVKRADEEYENLNEVQKEILRRMFVFRLVQQGVGTEAFCRRATWEELITTGNNPKIAEQIINRWAGPHVRLLTVYPDEQRNNAFIESNETLIRRWGKIKEWCSKNRETAFLISRLQSDAAEWKNENRNADFLYRGIRLQQMKGLLLKHRDDLTPIEVAFIEAGINQHDGEQKEVKSDKENFRVLGKKMPDIFISYNREDQNLAKTLAEKLTKLGRKVWWDRHIPAGKYFRSVIEENLEAAKCVIVLWTINSVKSAFVRDEAADALKRGKLIPIQVGEILPPLGFRGLQSVQWKSNLNIGEEEFNELLLQINPFIGEL